MRKQIQFSKRQVRFYFWVNFKVLIVSTSRLTLRKKRRRYVERNISSSQSFLWQTCNFKLTTYWNIHAATKRKYHDKIQIKIYLGFHLYNYKKVRLKRINTYCYKKGIYLGKNTGSVNGKVLSIKKSFKTDWNFVWCFTFKLFLFHNCGCIQISFPNLPKWIWIVLFVLFLFSSVLYYRYKP